MPPKYSVLLPVYNGIQFLPSCINTITENEYEDYELIISDDNSTDGSTEYLHSFKHPRVRSLFTPSKMSMAEHWEWVLSHACGKWMIFVGQDDGLQPYFFHLADILTNKADKAGVRAIASVRAYYFWKGCEDTYGETNILYTASTSVSLYNTKLKAFSAVVGGISYFELPQMYTSSLFHHSLLDEARQKQGGKIFVTHPQDANLAAISCALESHYLYSGIPLGWIGTSPKSAGLATGLFKNSKEKEEYLYKIAKSSIPYSDNIGAFELSLCVLYYYGALLMSDRLQSALIQKILRLKLFLYIVFIAAYSELKTSYGNDSIKREAFYSAIRINRLNLNLITIFSPLHKFSLRCLRFIMTRIFSKVHKRDALFFTCTHENHKTMRQASEIAMDIVTSNSLFQRLVR